MRATTTASRTTTSSAPDMRKEPRPHGVRSKYVSEKCRCDACTRANRDYNRERVCRAISIANTIAEGKWAPQAWTTPDGFKEIRYYTRKCAGMTKAGCPHHSHLRKDSKGGLCSRCREHAVIHYKMHGAEEVQEKLLALSAAGMGSITVMKATGLSRTTLQEIRRGRKHVLPETERKILLLKPTLENLAPNATVPGLPTWRKIRFLLLNGFTRTEIARHLGSTVRDPKLQLSKKRVSVRHALAIKELYDDMLEAQKKPLFCDNCGLSHAPAERRKRLERFIPGSPDDVIEAFPCIYAAKGNRAKSKQARMLNRDFLSVGAVWNIETYLYERATPKNG